MAITKSIYYDQIAEAISFSSKILTVNSFYLVTLAKVLGKRQAKMRLKSSY